MLEFIKQFFKKPEKQEEIETIDLDKIEDWLNKHTSDIIEDIDKEINSIYAQISEDINELKHELENLKNATLRNENIILRAKQIMEGNRTTYIDKIIKFTDALDLTNNGFFSGKRFCKEFEANILELNNQTLKSYYVLQEFFGEESGLVAKRLKKIDEQVKEMKEIITKSPIYNLDDVQKSIKDFRERQKALKQLSEEITKKKGELEEYRLTREKVELKMAALKKSDVYLSYRKLSEDKAGVMEEIKRLETDLGADFSLLLRPLKKHSRLALNEKLVEQYSNDPLLALLNDDKLEILSILEQLRTNIISNKLELKDTQKDKPLQAIDKLHRRYFEDFLNKYKTLRTRKKDIDSQILSNNVNQDFNDLQYKYEHLLGKCKHVIDEINNTEKNKLKLNLDELRKELETKFSTLAMKKVKFIDSIDKLIKEKQEDIANKENSVNKENIAEKVN